MEDRWILLGNKELFFKYPPTSLDLTIVFNKRYKRYLYDIVDTEELKKIISLGITLKGLGTWLLDTYNYNEDLDLPYWISLVPDDELEELTTIDQALSNPRVFQALITKITNLQDREKQVSAFFKIPEYLPFNQVDPPITLREMLSLANSYDNEDVWSLAASKVDITPYKDLFEELCTKSKSWYCRDGYVGQCVVKKLKNHYFPDIDYNLPMLSQ